MCIKQSVHISHLLFRGLLPNVAVSVGIKKHIHTYITLNLKNKTLEQHNGVSTAIRFKELAFSVPENIYPQTKDPS